MTCCIDSSASIIADKVVLMDARRAEVNGNVAPIILHLDLEARGLSDKHAIYFNPDQNSPDTFNRILCRP
jgi:hypothetical protein